MHRQISLFALALLAMGLFLATPAAADDTAALREEVKQLQERLDTMTTSGLGQEVEDYLASNQASQNAQGGSRWDDVTVQFRFLAQGVASIGYGGSGADESPFGNDHNIQGLADLDFDFNITENLKGFIHLTARTNQIENGIDVDALEADPDAYLASNPLREPLGQRATAAGVTDGIGTDGNTAVTGPGLNVYEVGIQHALALGSTTLNWQAGKLDPRNRFGQNAYTDSAQTQFLNNAFNDSSAIMWLSNAGPAVVVGGGPELGSGSEYYAWFGWLDLGANKDMKLEFGWWNGAGQFFTHGQFYVQFHVARETNGRPMNIRIFGVFDNMNLDAKGDGSAAGGVSWDMKANDKLGVFVKFVLNDSDINPVEWDMVLGVAWNVNSSSPDDVLGIGLAYASINDNFVIREDSELTIEVYYNHMAEGGKLQISPMFQYIQDPYLSIEDSMILMGLRIFVHF